MPAWLPDWFPRTLAQAAEFAPLRIVFLVVVALVARAVVNRLIDRTVAKTTGDRRRLRIKALSALRASDESDTGRRDSRIRALGSLARNAATVLITIVTVLMIFSEMGFNITSLIAGTSVVAVTIAFGLQNVVKDFVAGVTMLVEDQFGVGDYIDMKEASGTVEAIGLRTTTLRDDGGNTWYVRNGEIVRVGNFSQGGSGRPPADYGTSKVRLVDPVTQTPGTPED
jgi:moderate conductance mechanosensitive channel